MAKLGDLREIGWELEPLWAGWGNWLVGFQYANGLVIRYFTVWLLLLRLRLQVVKREWRD